MCTRQLAKNNIKGESRKVWRVESGESTPRQPRILSIVWNWERRLTRHRVVFAEAVDHVALVRVREGRLAHSFVVADAVVDLVRDEHDPLRLANLGEKRCRCVIRVGGLQEKHAQAVPLT